MFSKRIITSGLAALIAAWLCVGQAALVYAIPATQPAPQTQQTPATSPPITTPTAQPASNPAATTAESAIQPTCTGGGLGWLVCPLVNTAVETIQKLAGLVIDMLQVKPVTNNTVLYSAWKSFRNLADIAFILIFLVLIFATTFSINISAYQIKTLLPKLIAAVILVQISFFITSIAIDIGNVLGVGIAAIVSQAGGGQSVSAGIGAGGVVELSIVAIGAFVTAFILTWPFVGLMLLAMFLAIAGVFVTLAARQLVIAVLIMTSPLAFAAWVLPGTQSLFTTWYRNLVRIILLYPLIVIILSAGALLSRAAQGDPSASSVGGSHEINVILASIIPIIAFFSIPATFKWAGSILNWAQSNYIMKWSRGASHKVRTSQVAQDIKATRKEKGFIGQRDIPNKFLGNEGKLGAAVGITRRYKNRLQAGQIGIGQPSRRRLVSGYDAAIMAQVKDWQSYFDDQQWGNSQVYGLASTRVGGEYPYEAPDGSKRTFKNPSKAMRIAAIARWTASGGNLETSMMMNQIFDPRADNGRGEYQNAFGMSRKEVTDMWFRGLGAGGAMAATIGAVPPVNPGKMNSVWDTMSAAQLATIHGSSAPFFFTRVMADIEPSKQEELLGKNVEILKRERVERVVENLAAIARSRDLSGRVDQILMKRFRDAVIEGSVDIDPLTKQKIDTYDQKFTEYAHQFEVNFNNEIIRGDEFLRRYISPLGKVTTVHQDSTPSTPSDE